MTTAPILGLFVLVLLCCSCWIQIWQWKFEYQNFVKKFKMFYSLSALLSSCIETQIHVCWYMGDPVVKKLHYQHRYEFNYFDLCQRWQFCSFVEWVIPMLLVIFHTTMFLCEFDSESGVTFKGIWNLTVEMLVVGKKRVGQHFQMIYLS